MTNLIIKVINLPEGTYKWSVASMATERATLSNAGGYIFTEEGIWLLPEVTLVHLNIPDGKGIVGFVAQNAALENITNFNIMETPESGTYVADFKTQTMTLEEEILPTPKKSWLPWAGLGLGILVLTKVFKKRSLK